MKAAETLLGFLKPAVFLLATWYAISISGLVSSFLFPTPMQVFASLGRLFLGFGVMPHLLTTISETSSSIAIGSLAGIGFGVATYGKHRISIAQPIVDFMRSIPATAMFPLFMLFFGIGNFTNFILATFVCFLYVSFHTLQGLKNASKEASDFAVSLRKTKSEILTKVKLPESMPMIFAGIRTAASITLVVIIILGMFAGSTVGLGRMLIDAAYVYEIPELYAIIIIIGFFGAAMNRFIEFIENRVVHWKNSQPLLEI